MWADRSYALVKQSETDWVRREGRRRRRARNDGVKLRPRVDRDVLRDRQLMIFVSEGGVYTKFDNQDRPGCMFAARCSCVHACREMADDEFAAPNNGQINFGMPGQEANGPR